MLRGLTSCRFGKLKTVPSLVQTCYFCGQLGINLGDRLIGLLDDSVLSHLLRVRGGDTILCLRRVVRSVLGVVNETLDANDRITSHLDSPSVNSFHDLP